MTETTYTILDSTGEAIKRGLSLADAADEIMTSDGREWEIRKDPIGWVAWSRHQVAGIGWTKCSGLYSIKNYRLAAERDIHLKIVNAERWPGHCETMTDAAYDEMMAHLAEIWAHA